MADPKNDSGSKVTWFVGAAYGGTDDQLPRFLADGIWENGYENKHLDVVRSMRPGERIAVKSSYTRIEKPARRRHEARAKDSKAVRLSSVSPYLEWGMMWLPEDAPWLADFEAELLGFPGARYDDQVDSLSQYFGWVRERPTSMFEWYWMCDEDPVDHERIAAALIRGR